MQVADNVEMKGIEFKIVNDSTQAVAGLNNLTDTLKRLKAAAGGGISGLSKTAKGIRDISSALKGLNSGDFSQKISRIAGALGTLERVGTTKISSSIANQLSAINEAVANVQWTDGDKLAALADGLHPLSELGKANMTTFITQLGKLPELIEKLDKADLDKFTQQMKDLAAAMEPFADEMQKVSAGFSSFPSRIQQVIASSEQYNNAMRGATANTNGWNRAIKGIRAGTIALAFRKIAQFLGRSTRSASEYLEDMNLFTVSMGEYAEEAYQYAQQVSEIMGIDPAEWMRNQGVFNTIITGFGVASDKAALMSKNLTQLGYDIASFYNISFEDSMQKVQSGIAGELEPLRRIGYDLSVASLQQEAYSLGITKSVSAMTQAEKAQLRYYTMMTQVTQVQGDMTRTLEQPTNMIRVLQAQFEQAARAIGNLFIPVLTKLLPFLIAVADALRQIIAAIAALFNVEIQTPAWGTAVSGSAGVADNLSAAAGSAKELTKYLAGFDELNVLPSQNQGGGSAGVGGGGGDLGIDLPEYNFLEGAVTEQIDAWKKKIEPLVSFVKDNLQQILTIVGLIGAAFLGWKVSQSVVAAIDAIKSLSALGSFLSGLTLSITGFSIEWAGIKDAIQNGLSGLNFGAIIGGGLLGTGGSALLGKAIGQFIAKAFSDSAVAKAITAGGGTISTGLIGAAIGGIVAGIPMFVTGVYDAIVNGLNALNALLIPVGSTLAGAGVGAIIGSLGGPIGAGIGALIGLAIGALTDFGILIAERWDEITGFFADGWKDIKSVWGGVATWFDKNVIQPIVNFFAPVVNQISEFFRGCWIIVQAVWQEASTWFNEVVIRPVVGFFKGVWVDVSGFFKKLWADIVKVWAPVANWFNTQIVQPITKFFTAAWANIKEAFEMAFTAIGNFAKSIFNGMIGSVENVINRIVNGINGLIGGFNKVVSWAADVIGADWNGLTLISTVSLPRLAEGGFADQGQLFIAREAGPEMVGTIGNRAAVANNDQIVEAIKEGVYEAVYAAVNNSRGDGNQSIHVYLDGKELAAGMNRRNRMYGAAIANV